MSLQTASRPHAGAYDRADPSASAQDNARLLRQAERDLEATLVELHERYALQINRLVWRLLGPDPDQEDLVQQVFVVLLRSICTVRDPAKLDAWVRMVTVNTVRQELRRRGARRLVFSSRQPADPAADMVGEVESRDLLATCKGMLDKLSPDLRIAFVLHYIEGFSQREVADICGCALITAKRRVKAADSRFRQLVAHEPELLKRLGANSPSQEASAFRRRGALAKGI